MRAREAEARFRIFPGRDKTLMRTIEWPLLAGMIFLSSPAPAAADEGGRMAPVQAGSLYYEETGRGDQAPLVLVNGGPGFDHSYLHDTPVWNDLSRNHRIVFFDQRGTGRSVSEIPTERLTVDLLVADLEALRVKLGVRKISLLGHSFGGFLAMAYAVRHPDKVDRLILVGSGSPRLAATQYLFDKLYPDILNSKFPDEDDSPAGRMGCKKSTLPLYARMSFYDQRNRQGAPDDGGDFSEATCTAVMLDAVKIDLSPELSRINVPTLVLNGRFDANVAPTVAFGISNAIGGSQLVFFERSGHTPFVEEPDRFELVLERFLNQ